MPKCNLLNNHACLSVEGNWRICCKFDDPKKMPADLYTFNEFKNSDQYVKVVKTMESKWHLGCQKCLDDEIDQNVESLREYSLRELSGSNQIEYLEISLANDCNLNCRMCGPKFSSAWERFLHEHHHLDIYYHKELLRVRHPNFSMETLFGDLDLSNLKIIKYLGGEPFVTKQIIDMFEFLEKRNLLRQIEFQANTNCTLFPKKYIDYLKKFKKIIMTLSIDGYQDLNDYIRNGSSWSVVDSVVNKWVNFAKEHNCTLIISPTLLPYNVHDLTNLRLYSEERGIKYKLHPLVNPERFRLDSLPLNYLKTIENQDNSFYINKSKFNIDLFNELSTFTKQFDLACGKHLKEYIPNLESILYV